MASTSGYGYSLTANCSNLRRDGDTVYVTVSISGSSYYSGTLYVQGTATGNSWLNANGGSGSGTRTLSWNCPGAFSSRTIECRMNYQIQKSGGTSRCYVYPATGSLGARTYSIQFNANGGSNAPSTQTKTYGTDLTLSSVIPTRTNYIFIGWNTAANGTGTSYAPGATYSANAAVTLYAQWEEDDAIYINNEKYSVYIDNGSSWEQYSVYIDNGSSWDKSS